MNEWISVNERLPEDGIHVIICTQTAKGLQNIKIGYYSHFSRRWVCGMNDNVTHWMPLPEPPEVKG